MALHVPPVANETDAIHAFLAQAQDAFRALLHGLTPRQAARSPRARRPSPSAGWSSTSPVSSAAGSPAPRPPRAAVDRRAVRRRRRLPRRLHVPRDRLARGPAGDVRRGLRGRARRRTPDRPGHPGPGAGRAVVPEGRRGVERPLGLVAPDGGAVPARRARRHRPRDRRRRDACTRWSPRATGCPTCPGCPPGSRPTRRSRTGVSTVRLHAADLPAARAWYADLLGAEPYFVRDEYVEWRVGPHDHELGILDLRYAPAARAGRARHLLAGRRRRRRAGRPARPRRDRARGRPRLRRWLPWRGGDRPLRQRARDHAAPGASRRPVARHEREAA